MAYHSSNDCNKKVSLTFHPLSLCTWNVCHGKVFLVTNISVELGTIWQDHGHELASISICPWLWDLLLELLPSMCLCQGNYVSSNMWSQVALAPGFAERSSSWKLEHTHHVDWDHYHEKKKRLVVYLLNPDFQVSRPLHNLNQETVMVTYGAWITFSEQV